MLCEFNGKIYIKPFPNKMIEVEITKNDNEYNISPTKKEIRITPEIREKIFEIDMNNAYKKASNKKKKNFNTYNII